MEHIRVHPLRAPPRIQTDIGFATPLDDRIAVSRISWCGSCDHRPCLSDPMSRSLPMKESARETNVAGDPETMDIQGSSGAKWLDGGEYEAICDGDDVYRRLSCFKRAWKTTERRIQRLSI